MQKLKERLLSHRYELIALLTGAAVMMLEIVGARLIAPYFGTSTYVWTAMIGVILGALSIGFWYGGRLADRDDSKNDLSLIIAFSALLILISTLLQDWVLRQIASQELDLRLSSFMAALILFGPPSLMIGMVSPHLAKIRVTSLKTSGTAIGRLEAAGALGSIFGTFLSGYVLLAYFGARNLSLMLVVLLILTSLLSNRRRLLWPRLGLAGVALLAVIGYTLPDGILLDRDSAYSRYQVRQIRYDNRNINVLMMDSYSYQSGSDPANPEKPVFKYVKAMHDAALNLPSADRILVIGGGAYTLPTSLAGVLPDTRIDVVEIDPAMDEIAEEFFGYQRETNITIYHEDGRSFLNNNETKYDLVFVDAFSSLTPPFHLTSLESVKKLKENLTDNGVVVANLPGKLNGEFVGSVSKTYSQLFTSLKLFQAEPLNPLGSRQNFLLVASDNNEMVEKAASTLGSALEIPVKGFVLTDDYAPVERLSF